MIGRTAVDTNPAELHPQAPLGELAVGAGVLAEVAGIVCLWLIEGVPVIAGMNDEDIALAHLYLARDVLGTVDVVIAAVIADVDDDGRTVEPFQRQAGDILAVPDEVHGRVDVGADVQHGLDALGVDAFHGKPLGPLDDGSAVCGPAGSEGVPGL